MPLIKFKKNLFIYLILSAIVLVAINILLKSNFFNQSQSENDIDETNISLRFKNILNDFGIEDRLIKESKINDKNSGREFSSFKIQVPKDLSIPEILQSIFQSFIKDSLNIQSIEKVKGSKSTLALKSGRATVLQSEFDYSKNYSRNKGYIALIMNDVDPARPSIISLIESSARLNFLFRPDISYLQYLDFIRDNGQQFSILIDDDISDQKYRLDASHSEQRVVSVIKTLVTDFKKAVCFIVDDNSAFYNSENYKILRRELSKRYVKLFKISEFVNLNYSDTLSVIFGKEIKSLSNGEQKVFLLSEESYSALTPEIAYLKKQGYRFILSSLILSGLSQ
jgi:hypothetical protein